MTTTPSSKAAWASGLALGSATGVIGFAPPPRPPAPPPCPHAASGSAQSARSSGMRLLITAHLLETLERDLGLAEADGRAQLTLLRVLVLREARERVADRL